MSATIAELTRIKELEKRVSELEKTVQMLVDMSAAAKAAQVQRQPTLTLKRQ